MIGLPKAGPKSVSHPGVETARSRLQTGAAPRFGAAPQVRPSRDPDLEGKIRSLMAQAGDDRLTPARSRQVLDPLNIRRLDTPRGRVRIFRILLTNACKFECLYCPMQRGRALERHALDPEQLVAAFLTAWKKGWADALFLTTAIPGEPWETAERTIRVVESLRIRHEYPGYIHAKIVPGAERDQVRKLAELCNRISCNLEFSCGASFEDLAPEKDVASSLQVLRVANRVRSTGIHRVREGGTADPFRPHCSSGSTTQFVVGATEESDRRLLKAAQALSQEGSVHHTHFAAFRPIRATPLEGTAETPFARELRLYQSEYLIRLYRFTYDELPFDERGILPQEVDPKTAWAESHPELFPVELSTAPLGSLLRVPGIGRVTASRIVEHRRKEVLHGLTGFRKMGVALRAMPYLAWKGRRLAEPSPRQLTLPWEPPRAVSRTYEVSPGTFR